MNITVPFFKDFIKRSEVIDNYGKFLIERRISCELCIKLILFKLIFNPDL